ncbi:helix-turn-helix transcriptional regulator [soil metagenome]
MAQISEFPGPHPVDIHVGRRVCERRLSLGFNQSVLAKALGLTFQQVQKYEKGSNRISASKLWNIARFLNVDISYFFEGLSGAPHVENGPVETSDLHGPVTRHTIDIARLAPQLSLSRQKLALELIRNLTAPALLEIA